MNALVRRTIVSVATAVALLVATALQAQSGNWNSIVAKAKGQTVQFNGWGGDEKTNDFIAWAGAEVKKRYGVTVNHVRVKDTSEACCSGRSRRGCRISRASTR